MTRFLPYACTEGAFTMDRVKLPAVGITLLILMLVSVNCGLVRRATVTKSGTVWAWGDDTYGQLGDGTNGGYRSTPIEVERLTDVTAVAAGSNQSLALKADGTVWTWGALSNRPVQVSGLTGVTALAAGFTHSLALKDDGTVWAWGINSSGQLGNGTSDDSNIPVQVSGLGGVRAIATGGNHSLALKSDGTLWAWGINDQGQLADGTTRNSNIPVEASKLTGITSLAAGYNQSLALRADGTEWFWHEYSKEWSQVKDLTGVTTLTAGGAHTLALKSDSTVWAWGANNLGQLGNGTTISGTTIPVQARNLTGVIAVAAGSLHSLAIVSSSK